MNPEVRLAMRLCHEFSVYQQIALFGPLAVGATFLFTNSWRAAFALGLCALPNILALIATAQWYVSYDFAAESTKRLHRTDFPFAHFMSFAPLIIGAAVAFAMQRRSDLSFCAAIAAAFAVQFAYAVSSACF